MYIVCFPEAKRSARQAGEKGKMVPSIDFKRFSSLYTAVGLFFFPFCSKISASAEREKELPFALAVTKSPSVFHFLSRALDRLMKRK